MSRKRNGFDVLALRRHEIERLARHTGVAETDDLPEVLRVWAQQNPHSKDPTNALLQELLVNTYQDEMRVLTTVHEASDAGKGI